MTPLAAALDYHTRGWPVIPGHTPTAEGLCSCAQLTCTKPGKHPREQWRQYQKAMMGDGQVRTWWRRWPGASVIVLTGELSGLLVIDVDPRAGGDESLRDLNLPPTVTSLTGGGGQHLWYRYPHGSGITIGAGLLPGIDWRGEGGYVIAPPSLHASGQRYAWEPGYAPDEHELAPLPAHLLALLSTPKAALAKPESAGGELLPYITGERQLPVGQRNQMLAQFAGHMFAAGNLPDAVVGTLWLIAQQAEHDEAHPPLSLTEVQATAESIHRAELRKRELAAALETATLPDNLSALPDADVVDLARAAWGALGVGSVVDWVRLVSADGVDYQIELTDRTCSLGPALIGGQRLIRDAVLNATVGQSLIPRMTAPAWDRHAALLARLAREVYVGSMRQSDEVQEWLDEYRQYAVEAGADTRESALRRGPVLLDDGRLAARTQRMIIWLEQNFAVKLETKALGKRLILSGWKYQTVWCGGKTVRCWVSPGITS